MNKRGIKTMRIVTWNANMKFRDKQNILIERLNPDVAFIQECENPKKYPKKFTDELFPYRIWNGDNENKGIAVFSKYKIIKLDSKSPSSRFYIPFKINGTFFIGIWAMNEEVNRQNRYIAQVWNILKDYNELLNNDLIILGDFNWSIIWDEKPDYPLVGNFRDVNTILNFYDMASAYHHHLKEDFGEEKNHTFFMHRKEEKPYHTDYIYLKKNTIENLKEFYIGKHDEWIKHSDHMPLLIEI